MSRAGKFTSEAKTVTTEQFFSDIEVMLKKTYDIFKDADGKYGKEAFDILVEAVASTPDVVGKEVAKATKYANSANVED